MPQRKKKKTILTEVKWQQDPTGYRRCFALRLFYLLVGPAKLKRLPQVLRRLGAEIPPDWTPADPLPPGDYMSPGIVFPPDWTPEEPVPPGVVIPPGMVFPPGWTPGDTWPPGVIGLPGYGDIVPPDNTIPPIYVAPGGPGPPHPPVSPPIAGETTVEITCNYDGWVRSFDTNWSSIRGAESGTGVETTNSAYEQCPWAWLVENCGIYRVFESFDLSSLPSGKTVTSATLLLTEAREDIHIDKIGCQEGTFGATITVEDYNAFTGDSFGNVTWDAGENCIELNSAGLTYLSGRMGSTARLCIREYTHDVLNVQPSDDFFARLCMSENPTPAKRPRLAITHK